MKTVKDRSGMKIRLTDERQAHIHSRPEMKSQVVKIRQTLERPDIIKRSAKNASVHVYHKRFEETPVTEKYLRVIVKVETESPFIITAFFTNDIQRGETVWEAS